MCHTRDMLDNKLLEGGKIVPVIGAADLKYIVEDTIIMHKMQAERKKIKIVTMLVV